MPVVKFEPNMPIDAVDFKGVWHHAQVLEVDYEESEVLVHYTDNPNKYDEWIAMTSKRLRILQPQIKTEPIDIILSVQEAVLPASQLRVDVTQQPQLPSLESPSLAELALSPALDSPGTIPNSSSPATMLNYSCSPSTILHDPHDHTFVEGERCLAAWSDARKFPATVTKVIDAG